MSSSDLYKEKYNNNKIKRRFSSPLFFRDSGWIIPFFFGVGGPRNVEKEESIYLFDQKEGPPPTSFSYQWRINILSWFFFRKALTTEKISHARHQT